MELAGQNSEDSELQDRVDFYGIEKIMKATIKRGLLDGNPGSDFVQKKWIDLTKTTDTKWEDIFSIFQDWESQGIARILKDPELAAPDEAVLQMLTMFDGAEIWWKKNDPRLKDSGEI